MPDRGSFKSELRVWYQQWLSGRSKNDIERVELDDSSSHGKHITRLWREELGIETEDQHPMAKENERLKGILEDHGIDY